MQADTPPGERRHLHESCSENSGRTMRVEHTMDEVSSIKKPAKPCQCGVGINKSACYNMFLQVCYEWKMLNQRPFDFSLCGRDWRLVLGCSSCRFIDCYNLCLLRSFFCVTLLGVNIYNITGNRQWFYEFTGWTNILAFFYTLLTVLCSIAAQYAFLEEEKRTRQSSTTTLSFLNSSIHPHTSGQSNRDKSRAGLMRCFPFSYFCSLRMRILKGYTLLFSEREGCDKIGVLTDVELGGASSGTQPGFETGASSLLSNNSQISGHATSCNLTASEAHESKCPGTRVSKPSEVTPTSHIVYKDTTVPERVKQLTGGEELSSYIGNETCSPSHKMSKKAQVLTMLTLVLSVLTHTSCLLTVFVYWFVLVPTGGSEWRSCRSILTHSVCLLGSISIGLFSRIPFFLYHVWAVLGFSVCYLCLNVVIAVVPLRVYGVGYVYSIMNFVKNPATAWALFLSFCFIMAPMFFLMSWPLYCRVNKLVDAAPVNSGPERIL